MTDLLLGKRDPEVMVFIPSVITEYASFWQRLVTAISRDRQDERQPQGM